ncbi:MAG: thioredoxin family protein, partial [Propionibacteriaceae bacterium]|nr:thioredoxin family protein [Propionibacteriaceae bacterium]
KVIEPVLESAGEVRRILVEDGKGRPLGRSYRVKLWPTLIFLSGGVEVARVVRPWGEAAVVEAVRSLGSSQGAAS